MAEESKTELPKIRTFKTDAEIYMRDSKVSKLEMVSKSYLAQNRFAKKITTFNYKKALVILSVVLLLGVAGYAAYKFYPKFIGKPAPENKELASPKKFIETETEM